MHTHAGMLERGGRKGGRIDKNLWFQNRLAKWRGGRERDDDECDSLWENSGSLVESRVAATATDERVCIPIVVVREEGEGRGEGSDSLAHTHTHTHTHRGSHSRGTGLNMREERGRIIHVLSSFPHPTRAPKLAARFLLSIFFNTWQKPRNIRRAKKNKTTHFLPPCSTMTKLLENAAWPIT